LNPDPRERLKASDIKKHPFFANIQWENLWTQTPPFVPNLDDLTDTSYFDARNARPDIDAAIRRSDSAFPVEEQEHGDFSVFANNIQAVDEGNANFLRQVSPGHTAFNTPSGSPDASPRN